MHQKEMEGGGRDLSWGHCRDYTQGKLVMGPSSLSPTISAEALIMTLSGITSSQESPIKMATNGLTGCHTHGC